MSRRYVHQSKTNDLGQVVPEVMAVVTAGDNLISVDEEQKYFKRNYLETIKKIIPKFYFSDEQTISGTHVSYPDQLINSHILANKNQATVLPVSSLVGDTYLSAINTPSGFAHYFYKNSPPAQITPDDFQRNILFPLGKKLSQFATSSSFANFISGTFLPSIPSIYTGHHDGEDLAVLTASAYSTDSSGTYKYLANNLGWLYFLNRAGPSPRVGSPEPFAPSAALTTLMTETLWRGRSIVLQDSLEVYQEHLWRNENLLVPDDGDKIIPDNYVSSFDSSVGTWTSGTQNIDRLKTLVSIVYSPHFLDSPDPKVQSAFTTYLSTSSANLDGTLITEEQEAGPLSRFLEGMSFSLADRVTEQAEINTLYDIGKCPEEFLELLGELIGWKFIGGDIDKWRVQLRNAVEIYKMKGTKRSIQYLLDTLFSTGVFNVTTEGAAVTELWESYIPELIYYSLATSSEAFHGFDVYTPELALQFGVPAYDPNSMHRNIQYVVDKILFDLVREFPSNFMMGGKPFPTPQLMLDGVPYTDAYNIIPDPDPEALFPTFYTGSEFGDDSVLLTLDYDPNFLFEYRERINLVPPYEKKQYYTPTRVNTNMLERIEFYLICYGLDKSFAKKVVDYMRSYTTGSLNTEAVLNSFLMFTKEKTYPANYDVILRDATNERTPDPVDLLSMWNGKSSHFFLNFDSSSFDFTSQQLNSTSKYGLQQVSRVLDQVIPAHAIPEILLSVSSVADALDALGDNDCREWRPNFNDLYEGSSTVTTGFGVCAVDMVALATANGIPVKGFKRTQVDNVNDVLLSGTTYISLPRNSLRRRNFHNLLPETKLFTRTGRNNPGSLELSSPFYSSGIGYIPLGFMPSSLRFKEVALRQNTVDYGIGELLDRENVDSVWEICQNLNSPSSYFGYDISNTFPSRVKQNITSSDCATYGRRGQLQEIMYVMNKAHDQEKYLQASSIVSGYLDDTGMVVPTWPTSSTLITPTDLSSWYATPHIDVVNSIGNHLINKESADKSLNYYEHFTFGRPVHELYNLYMNTELYAQHGLSNNFIKLGYPNILSHTFGPLIYNSTFEIDGTALETSGYLAASSTLYEVNLAYYGGSGVLSPSGMNGLGSHELGTSAASASIDLPIGAPEFRNQHLVSSIELVDTSTSLVFSAHPTFSIFNLSRNDQSKYSYNKYLINNQIIKYHRGSSPDRFPRLRIPINNTVLTNKARNFLEPNHEYEISIKAHNLDVSSTELGGLNLGVWIHTDPELDQVYSYMPDGIYDECNLHLDKWETLDVEDVSSVGGINLVENKAQKRNFTIGNLDSLIGSGEGSSGGNSVITEVYDHRCWEPLFIETVIEGSNPKAITNVSPLSSETLKFKFSTKNNKAIQMSSAYRTQFSQVHRLSQSYVLEIFIGADPQNTPNKFVVFEEISIKDITNYNKAVIKTQYGDAQLDMKDLKAVLKYFKSLSNGLASRNAINTSSVMEVSGGSRLNYRSNSSMFNTTIAGATSQITQVEIHEG